MGDPVKPEMVHSPENICECGHLIAEHASSGWGPNSVCVEKLEDENDGWSGVCPCVRYPDDDDAGRRVLEGER